MKESFRHKSLSTDFYCVIKIVQLNFISSYVKLLFRFFYRYKGVLYNDDEFRWYSEILEFELTTQKWQK